ncbi:hypothetical protein ACFL6S_35220, partial [Candidatus Poribacteria bacterium]
VRKDIVLEDVTRHHVGIRFLAEVEMDARAIREVFPDVKLLQMFRFYTDRNGQEGQQYWFDNFRILPAGRK